LALEDYQEMATILAKVKSNFILNINDHPDIRDTFGQFKIKPSTLSYSAPKGIQTKKRAAGVQF